MKEVSASKFWRFVGILIVATVLKKRGSKLWERQKRKHRTFTDPVDLGPSGLNLMAEYRFKELKSTFSYAFDDKSDEGPWARIRLLIDGFNDNRRKNIAASIKKIMDESMCAFIPRTTKTGGLPTISFIFWKPEPLGTEFKVGVIVHFDVTYEKHIFIVFGETHIVFVNNYSGCVLCSHWLHSLY